jgi:hypothetical protein
MATVVSSVAITCPQCRTQATVRVWTCGCQGVTYADHTFDCKQPRPYFDVFARSCQKLDTHGANPQTH